MKRRISAFLCSIFSLSLVCGCNSGSSGGTDTASSLPDGIKMTALSAEELAKLGDSAGEIKGGYSLTKDGAEHAILDDFTTISFDISDIPMEERLYLVGEMWNENNEAFWFFPNQNDLAEGKLTFETLHFSFGTYSVPTREQLIDQWAYRTAARKLAHDDAQKEINNVLRSMVDDISQELGIQKSTMTGQVLRYIAAHDSKSDFASALLDGNTEALTSLTINAAAECIAGELLKVKITTGAIPVEITKSWGDYSAAIVKSFDDGDVKKAANEIAKTLAGTIFPPFDYANKFSKLVVAMADVWEADAVEEQYQEYVRYAKNGVISDDDWETIKAGLKGASHRLQSKGMNIDDLRAVFQKRFERSEEIEAEAKVFINRITRWQQRDLLNVYNWTSYSDLDSLTKRLDRIYNIREMLRDMLTVDGVLQKGEMGDTPDEEFLDYMALEWIQDGRNGRNKFYQYLRDKGIVLKPAVGVGAEYVWVLEKTDVIRGEYTTDTDASTYYGTTVYRASATEHSVQYNYKEYAIGDLDERIQTAAFRSTCSDAPRMVPAGTSVTFDLTCTIEDDSSVTYQWKDYVDLRLGNTADGTPLPASDSSKPNDCVMELWRPEGEGEPERIGEAQVVMDFPAEAENHAVITLTFNGSGSQTVWTYQYKALHEGEPHHWEQIGVVQHTQTDEIDEDTSDGIASYMKYTCAETEHSYRAMTQQDYLDPPRQEAAFKSGCTAPPKSLKANESFSMTMTCDLVATNCVNFVWSDDTAVKIDEPWLEYGLSVSPTVLNAAEENAPNACSVLVEYDNRDESSWVKTATVTGALPEGDTEYQLISVYFSGSGSSTEWVYQWMPDDK